MQGTYHIPAVLSAVKACVADGLSYTQIGKKLGMSRSQVAGIVDRHVAHKDRPGQKPRKEPNKLLPGSLGVIERQVGDKSRITLIAMPSLGELTPPAYSYTNRKKNYVYQNKNRTPAKA